MRKTIYIGNVASPRAGDELRTLVAGVGKVLHFRMLMHEDVIRRHGGYAVVELESEADARAVMRALHGEPFHGEALDVRPATAVEETASGHPRVFGTMNMGDDLASAPPAPAQPPPAQPKKPEA